MTTEVATLKTAPILYSVTQETIRTMADKFATLSIGGIDDKAGFDSVQKARMECVKARSAIEKTRKELKAESLEYGRRVDAEAKTLTAMIEAIEKPLEAKQKAIEDAKEKIRKEREDAIYRERIAKLEPYPQTSKNEALIRSMSDAEFDEYLTDAVKAETERQSRAAEQKRIAEENRIEAERIAAERAEMQRQQAEAEAERKRLQAIEDAKLAAERAELDRQRKEQEAEQAKLKAEADRLAKIERDRIEAERIEKAKAEAAERARIETEARVKREAEETERKRIEAELAAKREEELKPVRQKINEFADRVRTMVLPDVDDETKYFINEVLSIAAQDIEKIARTL